MKFKVSVHKIEPVVEMNIEADCRVDALKKAYALLDTNNNNAYILGVEQDSPAADICASHLKNVIMANLAKPGYPFYFGNGLRG